MTRRHDKRLNVRQEKQRKPVALLAVEGWNVTESKYFQSFQNRNVSYTIKILRTKSLTDPKGMLSELQKHWNAMELSKEQGDVAFLVTDLDCDNDKAIILRDLIQKNPDINFIISNPCFEIWFLLHFVYSTKSYIDGKALINELKKHIPDYEKNVDVSALLSDKTGVAIKNAEKLEKHFESMGMNWPEKDCNPRTDVNKMLNSIIVMKKHNRREGKI